MTSRTTLGSGYVHRGTDVGHGYEHNGVFEPGRGFVSADLVPIELGTPAAASANGVAAAATASDSVETTVVPTTKVLDAPRNVTIAGSGAGVNSVVTVRGADQHQQGMVEAITASGASTVEGKKAFKRIDSIVIGVSGTAGTINVGWGDVFGLPVRVDRAADICYFKQAGVADTYTLNIADTTDPATATTGDVRGTIVPTTSPNGSIEFNGMINATDHVETKLLMHGVPQYQG